MGRRFANVGGIALRMTMLLAGLAQADGGQGRPSGLAGVPAAPAPTAPSISDDPCEIVRQPASGPPQGDG
jgi:hypothetical protein